MSRPSSAQPISPRSSRSRAHSISSDRPSTVNHSSGNTPPTAVSPEASFIAASAASSIVTNDHDSHAAAWYDQNGLEPSQDPALVSNASLQLVNGFLDQLLFHILQVSKSLSLSALRPAVSEVLKPKLAKDAIANADEELREYFVGLDEDEYAEPQNQQPHEWDLELAWKRMRLRCMIYSSVGDLEEEDEDMYIEQEHLQVGAGQHMDDIISPAVAIFLTSVVEYMGELTLTVAGQAAYQRIRAKSDKELKEGSLQPGDQADQIIVEEMDIERVALDRTLGRLWRGWKKRLRGPTDINQRPYSRQSTQENMSSPRIGISEDNEGGHLQEHAGETIIEDVQPADIPLPMGNRDVDEIEVPGLVSYSDDDDDNLDVDDDDLFTTRPKSMLSPVLFQNGLPTPHHTSPNTPILSRKRSNSMPIGTKAPFVFNQSDIDPADDVVPEEADAEESEEVMQASAKSVQPAEGAADRDWDSDIDEDVVYEQAEVVMSSRISVSSSSSPSRSEAGHMRGHTRDISVQSARIIDVGPRTPSFGSGSPPRSSVESPNKPKRTSTGQDASAWAPVERLRSVEVEEATQQEFDALADERAKQITRVAELTKHFQAAGAANGGTIDEEYAADRTTSPSHDNVQRAAVRAPPQARPSAETNEVVSHTIPTSEPREAQTVGARSPMTLEKLRTQELDDSFRPPQKLHSASPSVSSFTGRFKPMRTSEDNSSASRSESVARNFEELIQSNQTITYTLTPETMRNLDSPIVAQFPTMGGEAKSPGLRQSPLTADSPSLLKSRDLSSSMVAEEEQPPLTGPVPRAPTGLAISTGRFAGPQARDARAVKDTSTADFAEFIRSTGPATSDYRPGPSANDYRPFPSTRNVTSPVRSPVGGPASPINRTGSDGIPSPAPSNASRFQARGAAAEGRNDNRDLIDFIRQGPPIATSNHRIPRHVAPFRTTMDSEEMSGVPGGKAIDATIPDIRYSQSSTNATEQSAQSSMHSNAALLNRSSKLNKMFEDESAAPQRTRRRVPDPYAIDWSDEEEEELMNEYGVPNPALSEPTRSGGPVIRKEESLAEFLQNYDPPSAPSQASNKGPKKKASAPSLMGRFVRTQVKEPPLPIPSVPADNRSLHTSGGASTKSGRGYIPIQVHMPAGYGKYGPIDDAPLRPVTTSRSSVPMKKFEPREPAGGRSSETAELAAFLRNSRPPPSSSPAPLMTPPREEEGRGLSKMFGRKKKQFA